MFVLNWVSFFINNCLKRFFFCKTTSKFIVKIAHVLFALLLLIGKIIASSYLCVNNITFHFNGLWIIIGSIFIFSYGLMYEMLRDLIKSWITDKTCRRICLEISYMPYLSSCIWVDSSSFYSRSGLYGIVIIRSQKGLIARCQTLPPSVSNSLIWFPAKSFLSEGFQAFHHLWSWAYEKDSSVLLKTIF